MNHPCVMLSSHFESYSDDLAANRWIRCRDDLAEHGIVLWLHEHLNDRANNT